MPRQGRRRRAWPASGPYAVSPRVLHPVTLARLQRPMTQKILSRISRVHHSTLSRIERGHLQPTQRQRDRIARALGVTPDSLFGDQTKATT